VKLWIATTAGAFHTEQLELTSRELHTTLAEHFLVACEVPKAEIDRALEEAATVAAQFGAVVLHVVLGNRRSGRRAPAQRREHRGGLAPLRPRRLRTSSRTPQARR